MAWELFAANTVIWIIVFICSAKGIKTYSYFAWFTVPTPIILIIIMVIKGSTLPGADDGIDMYFNGTEGTDINENLKEPQIWQDAVAQIFFSISVCAGIMTSMGSYNKRDKPILADALTIAFCNSAVSFLSGFAVFTIIGYLQHINNPVSSRTGGFGLAFIAWPTAANQMEGANFWNLLLFSCLLLLGLDSAFGYLEAIATVLYDTHFGKKVKR